MSDQLSPRRLLFLEKLLTGVSIAAAYRAAGFKPSDNESRDGTRILNLPEVRARFTQMQAEAAAKAAFKREDLIAWLDSAILTPAGQVDENHPLAQQVTRHYDRDGHLTRVTLKTVDKLKAANQLALLLGWFGHQSADTRSDALKQPGELHRERHATRPILPDDCPEDIEPAEPIPQPKPPKKAPGSKDIASGHAIERVPVPESRLRSRRIPVLVSSSPTPPQPAIPPPISLIAPPPPISSHPGKNTNPFCGASTF